MVEIFSEIYSKINVLSGPIGVAAIFVFFQRVGAFLEDEAVDSWKDAARSYLRSGNWVQNAVNFNSSFVGLFDKIFGRSFFAVKPLYRSLQISIPIWFFLYAYILLENIGGNGFVTYAINKNILISVLGRDSARAVIGFFLDYLSIIRIMIFVSLIRTMEVSFRNVLVCALLCMLDLFISYSICATVNWYYFAGLGAQLSILNEYIGDAGLLISVLNTYTIYFYISLIPTLIFYIYFASVVLTVFATRFGPVARFAASNIKFTQPFKAIAWLAAIFSSGLFLIVKSI